MTGEQNGQAEQLRRAADGLAAAWPGKRGTPASRYVSQLIGRAHDLADGHPVDASPDALLGLLAAATLVATEQRQ